MSKPELGVKRDCPECGARFYDLNKQPAHCPKCENEFVPEALLKPRRPRAEEETPSGDAAPSKPAAETSLEAAEKERKAPESKRKPSLDDDEDSDSDSDDELSDIEGIDIDDIDDDEDDDSLLDDDDEDDDVTSIVSSKDDED